MRRTPPRQGGVQWKRLPHTDQRTAPNSEVRFWLNVTGIVWEWVPGGPGASEALARQTLRGPRKETESEIKKTYTLPPSDGVSKNAWRVTFRFLKPILYRSAPPRHATAISKHAILSQKKILKSFFSLFDERELSVLGACFTQRAKNYIWNCNWARRNFEEKIFPTELDATQGFY